MKEFIEKQHGGCVPQISRAENTATEHKKIQFDEVDSYDSITKIDP